MTLPKGFKRWHFLSPAELGVDWTEARSKTEINLKGNDEKTSGLFLLLNDDDGRAGGGTFTTTVGTLGQPIYGLGGH